MIYDCFSFFNELDLLELRLNTLDKVVDKFILVEATWTHSGNPKPLYFNENKTRFAAFLDKIEHIVVDNSSLCHIPEGLSPPEMSWVRENVQRNAINIGLSTAKDDDVIIISDLDEIPRPEAVKSVAINPIGITNLNLNNYAYFLNYRNISRPQWTGGPQMLSLKTFRDPQTYQRVKYSLFAPKCANSLPSATLIRFLPKRKTIKNAGWHFSYIGGLDMIKRKFASYSHTENQTDSAKNDTHIKWCLDNGFDVIDRRIRFVAEPICNQFPAYLRESPIFAALIKQTTTEAYANTAWLRRITPIKRKFYDLIIAALINLVPTKWHPLFSKIRTAIGL